MLAADAELRLADERRAGDEDGLLAATRLALRLSPGPAAHEVESG